MTFRRRHRWFRRYALGFAFATVLFAGNVSAASAKFSEGGSAQIPSISQQEQAGASVPSGDELFIRNAIAAREQVASVPSGDELFIRNAIAAQDPYLTDVFVRQGESLGGPDGATNSTATATATRPDDRANRFAHLAPQPEPASSGWNVEWNQALTFGIGGLVLVLALGLGVGYLRRPRLAL